MLVHLVYHGLCAALRVPAHSGADRSRPAHITLVGQSLGRPPSIMVGVSPIPSDHSEASLTFGRAENQCRRDQEPGPAVDLLLPRCCAARDTSHDTDQVFLSHGLILHVEFQSKGPLVGALCQLQRPKPGFWHDIARRVEEEFNPSIGIERILNAIWFWRFGQIVAAVSARSGNSSGQSRFIALFSGAELASVLQGVSVTGRWCSRTWRGRSCSLVEAYRASR